nr:immunoglobulin light chain junction region [Macaca mulatta]MOW63369.1 immunoglobulin light chain junction region [Macaca mulatta]MOW63651.1 immunoglobulin light chain junction region [Macaca mulatta]MOW63888.1 immunoglobulin light chain junction region [Macaca mulatta]MOW64412.1 immunoglobulin light chain junction region [Macaca mulatta]
CIQSLDFPWTF